MARKYAKPTTRSPQEPAGVRSKRGHGAKPEALRERAIQADDTNALARARLCDRSVTQTVAETPSVHLTVGPASRSAAEFLGWLTAQLMNSDEFFRRDFPMAGAKALGGTIEGALEAHLDEFRRRLSETIQGDALMEALIRYRHEQQSGEAEPIAST